MKDLDNLIEHIHSTNAHQRHREVRTRPRPHQSYTLAVAAIAVLIIMPIIAMYRQRSETLVAEVESTQPVKHAIPKALPKGQVKQYFHKRSSDGIDVYCEDFCDPDEVIARLDHAIQTIDRGY